MKRNSERYVVIHTWPNGDASVMPAFYYTFRAAEEKAVDFTAHEKAPDHRYLPSFLPTECVRAA